LRCRPPGHLTGQASTSQPARQQITALLAGQIVGAWSKSKLIREPGGHIVAIG